MDNLIEKVGKYCKEYRKNVLKISLTDFCNIQGLNIKNVSAFEHGRANNIKYLYNYYAISDEVNKRKFALGLFEIL